jgi:hypothetical protein
VIFAYGPISVFVPNLVRCRHAGFSAYMTLASRYVTSFERKWIGGESSEELLGTADLQSLADLSNSVSIVREMHIVPAGSRLLVNVVLVSVAPLVPLLLFEYSVIDLLQRVAGRFL